MRLDGQSAFRKEFSSSSSLLRSVFRHKLCHEILHFRMDGKCRESAIGRGKTSVVSHCTIRFISANYSHSDTYTHTKRLQGVSAFSTS